MSNNGVIGAICKIFGNASVDVSVRSVLNYTMCVENVWV